MTHTSHYHGFHGWLVGLAAALMLLLWPGSVQAAQTALMAAGEAPAQPVTAERTPVQSSRAFLPLIAASRVPSSFTLIDRALTRRDIDQETALIYRVFATFGDARLPARYRGDDSGLIDSDAVSEATQRFPNLSPAARSALVPFLIPPVYAGSWYDLRRNGQAAAARVSAEPVGYIDDRCRELAQGLLVPLASTHFVVWYPPFDNTFWLRANAISINLEERIYPILTGLLRQPLSDAGLGCNPSDGRLDVYMPYDPLPGKDNVLAMVSVYPNHGCKATPTYMQVLQQGPSEVNTIAHEFMHMIQFAYDPVVECFDSWWMEATANWAIDYFENMDSAPDDQSEQSYSEWYLTATNYQLILADSKHEYGAYLWPFYLSHYTGSYHPELIAQIFAATEVPGNGDLYQVINDRIAGGWETRWPEFAALNLNLAPQDLYSQWDQFPYHWGSWSSFGFTKTVSQDQDAYYVWSLTNSDDPYRIGDLGIFYGGIGVADDVRLLAIANPFVGAPFMRLQALIKRPGQGWQGPEDWSARKWTVLCQDDPAEKVEQVILIYSNSNWQRLTSYVEAPSDLRVVVSDVSCAGWQGSSQWQIEGQSSDGLGQINYTIRGEAAPRFTLSGRTLAGDVLNLQYQPTAGNATWLTTITTVNFQTGQTTSCTRTGGGAVAANLGQLLVTEDLGGQEMNRQFFAAGLTPAPGRCPGLETWTHVPWLTTDLRDTGLRPWPQGPAGALRGSDSLSQSSGNSSSTTTSAWDFTARRGSP